MIKDFFQQMSQVLKEIILGILLFGIVIEGVFLWLVSEKWYFTVGLWIGIGLAIFMIIHMNSSIERSLELPESGAQSYMQKMVVLRIGIILLVMLVVCFLKLGNAISMFAGILTLKFSAYFQPLLHRLIEKTRKGR